MKAQAVGVGLVLSWVGFVFFFPAGFCVFPAGSEAGSPLALHPPAGRQRARTPQPSSSLVLGLGVAGEVPGALLATCFTPYGSACSLPMQCP